MTTNNNRKLLDDYVQAWVKADANALDKILDNGYKFNNPPPGITPDKKGAIEMAKAFHTAFPDQNIRIVKTVSEGNDIVARILSTGTHKGEFFGVPATNEKVETGILMMITVKNGKIVEDVTEFDSLGLMTQIGAVPPMDELMH